MGNTVKSALFREATTQEVKEAKGNPITHHLLRFVLKIFGTINIMTCGANTLLWDRSLLQKLIDKRALRNGHYDVTFIKTLKSFLGDRYVIEDEPVVFKAFFNHHRNDGIFRNSNSMSSLLEVIRKIFPEDIFTENDLIMTCDAEHTTKYRDLLTPALSNEKIYDFVPTMQKNAEQRLKNWQDREEPINVTHESNLYAIQNFSGLLFGEDASETGLAEGINFINEYVVKKLLKKATQQDHDKYKEVTETLLGVITQILKNENLPLFSGKNNLTPVQKKAMVYLLLFAGQETTAALLTYVLWQLALHPEIQDEIYQQIQNVKYSSSSLTIPDKVKGIYARFLNEFTPAYGVGRTLKKDVCLEYTLEGETESRKKIFFKDEIVSVAMHKLAEVTPPIMKNPSNCYQFGYSKHRCPGERLANEEILQFITALLEKYTIHTNQKKVDKVGRITLVLSEPVFVTLKSRNVTHKKAEGF